MNALNAEIAQFARELDNEIQSETENIEQLEKMLNGGWYKGFPVFCCDMRRWMSEARDRRWAAILARRELDS